MISQKKNKKIFIIGAVPHSGDAKSYGGTTTLMQNFLDFCKDKKYDFVHLDTYRYKNRIHNFIFFLMQYICGLSLCKYVMFNCATNGVFTLFYHIAPIAKFFHKIIIFRKFGGNFDKQLDEHLDRKERLIQLFKRSDLLLFETKRLVEYFRHTYDFPEKIEWFPNCRKPTNVKKINNDFHKRFAFISHLRVEKGVDIIIDVANSLPDDYVIDLYGSIYNDKYADSQFFNSSRVNYKGALKSEEVIPVLSTYDVLLLPTFWQGEGYPGIIIEAMSLGIPTIATNWAGIGEMIEDGYNGLIIPIKNRDALRDAILSINEENYQRMSLKAKERFDRDYNSDVVNSRIMNRIMSIK